MRSFVIFFLSLGPVCAGIAFLTVVRPLRLGRAARISLGVVLLACSLKFTWFGAFGGHIFLPELPSRVIHALSAGHDFVLVLAGLGVLWAVGRLGWRALWRVLRRARGARPTGGTDEEIEQGLTRRRVIGGALACVAAGVAAKGVHDGVRLPDVVEVELEFPDLPPAFDGYRIAHLSDLHISAAARADRTAGVVRLVNECKPDLIAITGDFVDGSVTAREADVAPLAELHAPDGVVGCTGNHEYYSGWNAWRDVFRGYGVRVLENRRMLVRRGNQTLAILGENDPVSRDSDIHIAASMVPHGAFRILLAHRPTRLREHAECHVRLQLSGHTHGGAARGLDRFVARANEGHVRGIYREHDLTLYVNSGTGQWAGFPARLGVPPEITLLTLKRSTRQDERDIDRREEEKHEENVET